MTIRPLILLIVLITALPAGAQSIFRDGPWYKLGIPKEGVYRITYDHLKKIGINPDKIDPRTIRIFGNPGGMLPQANSIPRLAGPLEIPLAITGESDGKFDKGDIILFYATGPEKATFVAARDIFRYENNLYASLNYCFITVGGGSGKRIQARESLAVPSPVVSVFEDYFYHEVDAHNELHSGREWYGEKFLLSGDVEIPFDADGIVPGSDVRIVSNVLGQSYASAKFELFLNDVRIEEQPVLPIPSGLYSVRGSERVDTLTVSANEVDAAARSTQRLRYRFNKATGFSQGYLDYVLVSFKRKLGLYGNQTIFASGASLSNSTSTFVIQGVNPSLNIWDVTDPHEIVAQQYSLSGTEASFTAETTQLRKFVAFNDDLFQPEISGAVKNQDLVSLPPADMLIVTHPLFKVEAERLAAYRAASRGWVVHVVTAEEVYNEFSSGRQDVTAIRDFVRHMYLQSPGRLQALLLFGKGSYDYKDRVDNNTNFVATYESRNSLHPLQTYSSDDFFGFLDEDEGEWQENPARDHTLDIGVGRLPVTTSEEATNVVDKIIRYETDPAMLGYWRKKITFVADDGNSVDGFDGMHQWHADTLAKYVDRLNAGFDTRKLYMGTYEKVVRPNGESVPDMTDDLLRVFDDGSLIINYTGHGSEDLWADERVFSDQMINRLDNRFLPFLVTATCEFGRQDDPTQKSGAELAVLRKHSGAIGLVTTARPVNATTNFHLNKEFYEALFTRNAGKYPTVGEVFMHTKNNSVVGNANRNFSLLADPSMRLAMPPDVVRITSVKTANGSDTLKALSEVIVRGRMEDPSGAFLQDFQGVAEVALFNRQIDVQTTGRNNPAVKFREWSNVLFRGKASVVNGEFEMRFILSKNISYAVTEGKLSIYAQAPDGRDANGQSSQFRIGGTETAVPVDNTPPLISLFIGDSTFTDGGLTDPGTYLLAGFADASGINISNYGIGNSIIATLDDDQQTFVLNDYFVAATDDFTRGTLRFPLRDLSKGHHTITLSAWDVHNNPASASISFTVTGEEDVVIESMGNYPNPVTDATTFFFTHNRSGDDLEAQLFIYSSTGDMIESLNLPIHGSDYLVTLPELDLRTGGKKLPAGLYLARLVVRSMSTGLKNERVSKVIVLN